MSSSSLCPNLTIDVTVNDLAMQDYTNKRDTRKGIQLSSINQVPLLRSKITSFSWWWVALDQGWADYSPQAKSGP